MSGQRPRPKTCRLQPNSPAGRPSRPARSPDLSACWGQVAGQGAALRTEAADVELDYLELEGYGPFRDRVRYRLGARGVRVVSGCNEDDAGADSNGAGKSALVMAPLWALTVPLSAKQCSMPRDSVYVYRGHNLTWQLCCRTRWCIAQKTGVRARMHCSSAAIAARAGMLAHICS